MIDGGLKSEEIMREAREVGVKVTRLSANSVVLRFASVLKGKIGVVKPIERTR